MVYNVAIDFYSEMLYNCKQSVKGGDSMKPTTPQSHNKMAQVNPILEIPFTRGTSVYRSPFFGMNLTRGEKMKSVMLGMPDGASRYPIRRERPEI